MGPSSARLTSLQSALLVKMYCSLIQAQSQQEQMVGVYRAGDATVSISGAPLPSAEHVRKERHSQDGIGILCVCTGWLWVQVFASAPTTIHYYSLAAHRAHLTPR